MQELTNRTFDEIDVGTSTRITHTFYKTDVEMLALVAGGVDAFISTGKTLPKIALTAA